MFIFYDKTRDEIAYMRNNILLEMKNYSLSLDDKRFYTDTTKKEKRQKFYTLYEDAKSLYILAPQTDIDADTKEMMVVMTPTGSILVPYANTNKEVQKIWYPKMEYDKKISTLKHQLFWQFILFEFGVLVLSLLAAWYTLRPLRSSLRLLEDFIKDIIHDLNTPLTSILLNLKMIETENDEIESIRTATQTIEMLHHNLDTYLREQKQSDETFFVDEIITRYVSFFTPLYDYHVWDIRLEQCILTSDKRAFERIIYNLLSNACKYNISEGKIEISLTGTILTIKNNSYGVTNPQRVFERFYKENERGLGIGLHIVEKLCQTLQIEKKFIVEDNNVIVELECKNLLYSH